MRLTVYLIIVVLSALVLSDVYYVQAQRRGAAPVVSYDLHKLEEVVQELVVMRQRAKLQDALLLIHDAEKIHGDVWQLQLARAEILLDLERAEQALPDLDAVLEQRPQEHAARALRARCRRDLHRIEEALADIDILIKQDPDSETPHFLLGTIKYAQANYQDAAAAFSTALQLNPESLSALYNRALTFAELNKYDHARGDMMKFIELTDNQKLREAALGVLKEWENR